MVAVNPRLVRSHARSKNILAKTDQLDAAVLADFAQEKKPLVRPLPDAQMRLWQALMARRRQLVEMMTMERNRYQQARAPLASQIVQHIEWLQAQLQQWDDDLTGQLRQSPVWREKDEVLRRIPGVAEVTTRTVLFGVPELGTLTHKRICALAGVAPLNRDSGKLQGQRAIWGGRSAVRCALYMAALSALRCTAVIRAFYPHLRQRGKPTKVAIVACMRKLLTIMNAMIKSGQRWQLRATSPSVVGNSVEAWRAVA